MGRTPLILLLAGLLLGPASSARAEDDADEVEAEELVQTSSAAKLLLEIHPRPRPLASTGPAKLYAEAKRFLARGQPAKALKSLAASHNELLQDREALLKGDALLALGDVRGARDAYLEALETSQIKVVSVAAARGLVNVYGVLGEADLQLEYLSALIGERNVQRRPNLLFERAVVLDKLGQAKEAGEAAWRVLQDFPSAHVAAEAERMLQRLKKRGVPLPANSGRLELARIRNLRSSGSSGAAESALKELEKKEPSLKRAILFERAELYKSTRRKSDERDILEQLHGAGLEGREGAKILMRLGQLAMSRDDNDAAIAYFDELARRYPKSKDAPEAQYFTAWIPYSKGQYVEAANRFLHFAKTFRRWYRRAEALWFAGWSAYLAEKDGLAKRAFEQLLEEHPTSEMAQYAHYWMGRMRERAGEPDAARDAYREVLKSAPLSYVGQWAARRLDKLGERVVLEPPPDTRRATLKEVLDMLGPDRPIGIDRAIALHTADVRNEGLEELAAVSLELGRIKDTRGRVMIAEMLESLGAHDTAYRFACNIIQDGADLVTGKPYAWRAWRLAFPKAFEEEVSLAAEAHDIDPLLVLSIMRTESSFRADAKSPVGARGLMQIMPNTAALIGRNAPGGRVHAARYTQPASNVWLGAWYLKKLLDRYGGQQALAAGAYNAGPGAMDRWARGRENVDLDAFVESIPYRETRRYVRRVLETYMVYRLLNAEKAIDLAWVVEKVDPPEGAVAF